MNLKEWNKKRKQQQTNFHVVAGPVLGAINMLRAHAEFDDGLNLGTVKRAQYWGWNTYYYLGGEYGVDEAFGKKYAKSLKILLEGLDRDIEEFDWEAAGDKTTDLYDEAMEFYNNHYDDIHPFKGDQA